MSAMRNGTTRPGGGAARLWRPLLGVLVAYAVAAQSLLIAIGGFALPAATTDQPGAFALCVHGGGSAPDSPGDVPGHGGCPHCIFCFAGAHHALLAGPPALSEPIDAAPVGTRWRADKRSRAGLPPYSIASPRGPPVSA